MPPPPPARPPLTLIVATTPILPPPSSPSSSSSSPPKPQLGIGQSGTLPWPRIKTDMNFFARVTTRPPSPGKVNAVIMGRKTYFSVPSKLRPLKGRISVVVSRDGSGAKSAGEGDGGPGRVKDGVVSELKRRREGLALQTQTEKEEGKEAKEEPPTDAFVSNSLETGLSSLAESYGEKEKLGKVFVIGGAEIYGAALRMRGGPVRIIMTHVQRKGVEVNGFPCDTFFPVSEGFPAPEEGWRTVDEDEVSEWVGEKVSSKWRDEGEVLIRVVGYERSV